MLGEKKFTQFPATFTQDISFRKMFGSGILWEDDNVISQLKKLILSIILVENWVGLEPNKLSSYSPCEPYQKICFGWWNLVGVMKHFTYREVKISNRKLN